MLINKTRLLNTDQVQLFQNAFRMVLDSSSPISPVAPTLVRTSRARMVNPTGEQYLNSSLQK